MFLQGLGCKRALLGLSEAWPSDSGEMPSDITHSSVKDRSHQHTLLQPQYDRDVRSGGVAASLQPRKPYPRNISTLDCILTSWQDLKYFRKPRDEGCKSLCGDVGCRGQHVACCVHYLSSGDVNTIVNEYLFVYITYRPSNRWYVREAKIKALQDHLFILLRNSDVQIRSSWNEGLLLVQYTCLEW
jgi:hypothetical protein